MADRLVKGDLATILRQMKAEGDSNGTIAKRLYAEHGIDVTAQTVANWWVALSEPTEASA